MAWKRISLSYWQKIPYTIHTLYIYIYMSYVFCKELHLPITPFGTTIFDLFELGVKKSVKKLPIFMASRMDHCRPKKHTRELSRTACRRPLLRSCSNISGTWVLSGRPFSRRKWTDTNPSKFETPPPVLGSHWVSQEIRSRFFKGIMVIMIFSRKVLVFGCSSLIST